MDTERRIKSLLRAHAFPLAYPVSQPSLLSHVDGPKAALDSQSVSFRIDDQPPFHPPPLLVFHSLPPSSTRVIISRSPTGRWHPRWYSERFWLAGKRVVDIRGFHRLAAVWNAQEGCAAARTCVIRKLIDVQTWRPSDDE